jgi:hypothetical protein
MVEVHLVRLERPGTIRARARSKFTKEAHRTLLTNPDSLDLDHPIPPVIGDVR